VEAASGQGSSLEVVVTFINFIDVIIMVVIVDIIMVD